MIRRLSLIDLLAAAALLLLQTRSSRAETKDLEFIAEHLPEAAMDQRLAALPLFGGGELHGVISWRAGLSLSQTSSGAQALKGALFAVSVDRRLSAAWSVSLFGFYDDLKLKGSPERRNLVVGFSRNVPLHLPAEALIGGLQGRARDIGVGVMLRRRSDGTWLGQHEWLFGLQWQRLELLGYASHFQLLSGLDAGVAGEIDYSHTYTHFAPMLGAAWPRERGDWNWTPHLLAVIPRPVRGVAGRITAPGIDVFGDTEAAGNGKHFGDPFIAAGLVVGYAPWHVTFDLGAVLAQRLVEPRIHKGIDGNWLVSMGVAF